MKFGQVKNPSKIDFTLPKDHKDTSKVFKPRKGPLKIFIGCAKWNRTDLKNFYPKGVKDELAYYSSQFNSIELNATFYNMPTKQQVLTWKNKTPDSFKFFPKITNSISHYKRLINVKESVDKYCDAISHFEEKLGMVFLQMHDSFKPKDFDRVVTFVEQWPSGIPLAIELRNEEWFKDEKVAEEYYKLLEKFKVTNIIVDTAGRRDMLHMRLTTPTTFIRYVGANHKTDYDRLDDWFKRVKAWDKKGLKELNFFVHQNVEEASPLLSAYFIEKLNKQFHSDLIIPDYIKKENKASKKV
jgi:uncharacterized protein YecE (DUF72 family)